MLCNELKNFSKCLLLNHWEESYFSVLKKWIICFRLICILKPVGKIFMKLKIVHNFSRVGLKKKIQKAGLKILILQYVTDFCKHILQFLHLAWQIPLGKVSRGRYGGCSNTGDLRAVLAFMAHSWFLCSCSQLSIVFSSVSDSIWKRTLAAAARVNSSRPFVQSWSCSSWKARAGSVCRRWSLLQSWAHYFTIWLTYTKVDHGLRRRKKMRHCWTVSLD